MNTHPAQLALRQIEVEMNATYLQRADAIRVVILALLSKQHAFILGLPGTSKSTMFRDFARRITGAQYFEQSMSRTMPPEAVLGAVHVPALLQGQFRRSIGGYLPTADIALIDEIGKMSAVLGHNILAIYNERIYHQVDPATGESTIPVPLWSGFSGSNELPTAESDNAAALWDRLLFRAVVDYVQSDSDFMRLMDLPAWSTNPTTISFDSLKDAHEQVKQVKVTAETVQALVQLRTELRNAGTIPSDRRWRQSLVALQASAFYDERDETKPDDLAVLAHVLWETPETRKSVERLCMTVANPLAEKVLEFGDQLGTLKAEVDAAFALPPEQAADKAARGNDVNKKLAMLDRDLNDLEKEYATAGKSADAVVQLRAEASAVKAHMYSTLFGVAGL